MPRPERLELLRTNPLIEITLLHRAMRLELEAMCEATRALAAALPQAQALEELNLGACAIVIRTNIQGLLVAQVSEIFVRTGRRGWARAREGPAHGEGPRLVEHHHAQLRAELEGHGSAAVEATQLLGQLQQSSATAMAAIVSAGRPAARAEAPTAEPPWVPGDGRRGGARGH